MAFGLIEEQDANPRIEAAYERIKYRYGGFLPDIYKAFANDPEYLESIADHIARVMRPSKVDAKTKEVIAFAVAAINNCDFCINAHQAGLKRLGYDDEAVAEILGTVSLWSEVTRFNIGAQVRWPQEGASPSARPQAAQTGTEG
jgi:AhpD family alkylhydroperoxidase